MEYEVDIALLKHQMGEVIQDHAELREAHGKLREDFDALNTDYHKLLNRGMGAALIVASLGAGTGNVLSTFLKKVGLW